MMDGDRAVLGLGIGGRELEQVFRNPELVGDVDEFCALPPAVDDDALDSYPCSAGHTACYISPYGDLIPACSFRCRAGTCGGRNFRISGGIRRN